jgi:hypothetical protein
MKPFQKIDRHPQWVTDLKNLNKQKIEKGVLLNCQQSIEAMFYTNLTAYQSIPEKKVIIDLMEKGYTVLINDDGTIPEEIKNPKNIHFVNLTLYTIKQ